MSEATGAQGTPGEGQQTEADPIKNVKAEFNRKLDAGLSEVNQKLESVLAALKTPQSQPKPAQSEPSEDLADMMYTNPKEYTRRIKEEARAEAVNTVTAQSQSQAKQQRIIGELTNEFPELQSPESPIYKKAVEHYSRLDDQEKANMTSWKTVVYQAAMDLDMKPKSKRPVSDNTDDFVMNGSSSSMNRPAKKKEDIDPLTLEFSRLLGRNVEDPKVREGLKKAAQRRNWKKPT